ncbi:MAG TPA: CHRD domain-containing protein [Candidatus Limnocylindrales bacterium]|nr:CHRD domain-containing protein [Candidatus Limnocylindrales bacterium]
MQKRRSLTVSLSVLLALVLGLMASGLAAAGGRPLSADLLGANEAPILGDPDGSGSFSATFNPGTGEVCYSFEVTGVEPLAAAHIHRAPAGEPGPVVIPTPPTSATGGSGCVVADRALILEILQDPGAFYFNVHNAPFQGGALRGQLTK